MFEILMKKDFDQYLLKIGVRSICRWTGNQDYEIRYFEISEKIWSGNGIFQH